jgi:hypothetical protein
MEHRYVDNRPISEELRDANEMLAARIIEALHPDEAPAAELARQAT